MKKSEKVIHGKERSYKLTHGVLVTRRKVDEEEKLGRVVIVEKSQAFQVFNLLGHM